MYSPRATRNWFFLQKLHYHSFTCSPALRKSFFRNFKLPRFLKKAASSAESIANIKVFDGNALQVKKRLGQGAFGDVYTTEFATTEGNVETVVVKKMLRVLDESEKKLFFKETTLRNGLHHPNIWKLLGVCHQLQAIMLEYVYFVRIKLSYAVCHALYRLRWSCRPPWWHSMLSITIWLSVKSFSEEKRL